MEIRHIVNEGFFIFGENGDELAKLTYRKEGEKLFFESTVVSPELRGQGIAGKLFDAGVKYARENGYKIVPICSYIVKKFESGEEIAQKMKELKEELELENVVLTRSEEGISLFEKEHKRIPTVAREVYDVTGAGDTFISTFLLAVSAGADLYEAGVIANMA